MTRIRVHYLCHTPQGEITSFVTYTDGRMSRSFVQKTKETISESYNIDESDADIQYMEYRSS